MATLERHAAGGSVAVFEAGEFFSGGTDGLDGRVVSGGVTAEDVVDGLVEDGPGFEVRGDVGGVLRFDEVDFVSCVGGSARKRIDGVSDVRAKFIAIEHFCLSQLHFTFEIQANWR